MALPSVNSLFLHTLQLARGKDHAEPPGLQREVCGSFSVTVYLLILSVHTRTVKSSLNIASYLQEKSLRDNYQFIMKDSGETANFM